jgi:hypothetical protein
MKTNRWVSRAAGAGALTLILAMPAVAQTSGDWQRNTDNGGRDRTQATSQNQNRNRNVQPLQRTQDRNSNVQPIQRTQDRNSNVQQIQRTQDRNSNVQPIQRTQDRNFNNGNNSNTSYDRNSNPNGSRSNSASNGSYRENQRVALAGRVSSFSRENNGYRVRLDRGQSFFVPESYYRSHSRNFGIGVSINLGGIFRGGDIYVDAGGYPVNAGYGYDNGYIRGVVDRVDYRTGIAWLRDDASGRLIEADMRAAGRYSRIDARDLRPGDFVELSGQWVRGNIFAVTQVDNVQGGRY